MSETPLPPEATEATSTQLSSEESPLQGPQMEEASPAAPEDPATQPAAPSTEPDVSENTQEKAGPETASPVVEKEVASTQKAAEVGLLASSILNRAANAGEAKGNQASAGEQKLSGIRALGDELRDGLPKGRVLLTDGSPAYASLPTGEKVRVLSIDTANGSDQFTCRVQYESENKSPGPETIGGQSILDGQLVSEATSIRDTLSPNDQKLFDLHIATIAGGESALEDKTPEEVNAIITESAKEAGILDSGTIRELVTSQVAKGDLNEEQASQIRELIAGKNLLDADTAFAVMQKLGTVDKYSQLIQDAKDKRASADATYKLHPGDEISKKEFDEATAFLKEVEGLNPEELIPDVLQKLYSGEIPPENATIVRDAMLGGNLQELAQSMLADKEGDPEANGNSKKRELAKNIGIGTGGLLLLTFYLMHEGYKAVKQAR